LQKLQKLALDITTAFKRVPVVQLLERKTAWEDEVCTAGSP